jgi:hypothetical protein
MAANARKDRSDSKPRNPSKLALKDKQNLLSWLFFLLFRPLKINNASRKFFPAER